jgi:hypothetical protein
MKSIRARIAVVVAFAVFASGCSWVTMQRPETLDPEMPVCVSNRLAPTIDSVQAASHGLGTIFTIRNAAAAASRGFLSDAASGYVVGAIIGGIGLTAIWTASAVSGFKRADACEGVKRSYFANDQTTRPTQSYDTSANTRRESDYFQEHKETDSNGSDEDRRDQSTSDEPVKDSEKSKYMSVIEAAMHCGSSRRDIWNKIDDGTFDTRTTEDGPVISKSQVKEECGEEPEVPME